MFILCECYTDQSLFSTNIWLKTHQDRQCWLSTSTKQWSAGRQAAQRMRRAAQRRDMATATGGMTTVTGGMMTGGTTTARGSTKTGGTTTVTDGTVKAMEDTTTAMGSGAFLAYVEPKLLFPLSRGKFSSAAPTPSIRILPCIVPH